MPDLQRRSVTLEEVDQVVRLLNTPDPAGILKTVTREEVGTVAVYLSPEREGVIVSSPLWN